MPLDFQLARLNMTNGVKRDQDDFIAIPSKPHILQDAVFEDADTIITRGGLTSLTLTALTGYSTIATIRRLSKNDKTLLIEADSGLHSYVPTLAKTRSYLGGCPSPFSRAELSTAPVGATGTQPTTSATSGAYGQYAYDSDTADNFSVFAWEERSQSTGRRIMKYKVIDESTKQVVLEGEKSGTDFYSNPRVVAAPANHKIYIYYFRYPSGTGVFNIDCISFNTSTGSVSSAATVDVAAGVTMPFATANAYLFDAVLGLNDDIIIAFRTSDNAGNSIAICKVPSSSGTLDDGSKTVNTAASFDQLSLCSTSSGVNAKYIVAYASANVIKGINMNYDASATVGPTTLFTATAATSIGRITMIQNTFGPTFFHLFADNTTTTTGSYPSPITDRHQILVGAYTNALVTSYTSTLQVEAFLLGRVAYDGYRYLLPIFYPSATEGSIYLVDVTYFTNYFSVAATFANVHLVATLGWGECGGLINSWTQQTRLAGGFTISGTFTQPFGRWAPDLQVLGGSITTPTFLNRADLQFNSRNVGAVEFDGVSYLGGATPQMFDGSVFCEQGFTHKPRILTAAGAGAGSPLAAGTYNFCATYAWQDAKGNTHESAPSAVSAVTITANQYVVPTLSTLGLTNKIGVTTRLWRTVKDGTVFYLEDTTLGNNNLSDAVIVLGDALYTTGGVPPNEMMQPSRMMCEHQQRMFWIGEDGKEIFYSQTIDKGFGPGIVSTYQRRVPADWGRAVGIVSMDEKLVVIAEKQIGFIYGNGPTLAGAQDSYSEPTVSLSDFGCEYASPLSVQKSGDVVWFNSPYGMRALARNMTLAMNGETELGAEIDDLTSVDASIRTLVTSSKQQTRFLGTSSSSAAWIWDKTWKQWSTFANHSNIDAIVVNDVYYHATASAVKYYSDSAAHELGAGYIFNFEFPWLSVAGVQGVQRVSHLMFLGRTSDATAGINMVVYINNNFSDTGVLETHTIAPVPNSGDTGLTSALTYHFELQITNQKSTAIKINVSLSGALARFRLSNMTLRVGIKKGRFKSAQRL